jgi:signal transduction histidine kinase
MRETLCVLLGGTYDVAATDVAGLPLRGGDHWDLVIAPPELEGAATLPAAARLWLGAGAGNLPRRFTPTALRRRVADALVAPPAAPLPAPPVGDWRLNEPFLDGDACSVAERARTSRLALHIVGEPGSGKDAVARAIHAAVGGNLHVCDDANPVPPATGIEPDATLLAIGVDRWPNPSRRALSALLASPAARRLRVLSTATDDLAEMLDRGEFYPNLYYQLTLLTLRLKPLRERPAAIPTIAEIVAAEIAANSGRPRPIFTDAARHRLSHYLWFGNLAELQAVLTRTVALHDGRRIDADDLRFDSGGLAVPAPAPTEASAAVTADEAGSAHLKQIIHELAHEFKNPLVTIKTFTQHCRKSLLASEPDATEFADMTGRAVDRMDDALENLLAFARMSQPSRREVDLPGLLRSVLANAADLSIDIVEPPPLRVRVDPEQTSYALDNLLRAIARDVPADTPVTGQFCPPDALLCQIPPGAANTRSKLSEIVAEDGGDTEEMPLGISIANAILRRNGAELRLGLNGEPRTVMIRFPLVENAEEAEVNRNGTSPRIDRR